MGLSSSLDILLYSPSFHTALFGRVPMQRPRITHGEFISTSLRGQYLHRLFGILNKKFVSSLFSPLYLFIQSFIYFIVDAWIFYTLGNNPILVIYFVAQVVLVLSIGALSVGSCVSLTCSPSIIVVIFFFFF